jgi:hypothetical protein
LHSRDSSRKGILAPTEVANKSGPRVDPVPLRY